ncbi:MAG: hypothetical protein DRO11_08835 [Methanobacteriota archaeon]|nr:MAG: hypothetical protein DRO11_08835 [Euryarchaeota archaeon]RLI29821.1 MAG: hypothetical protein DRO50_00820 [Candidatus Bathyarchaeota archaeon]
MKFPLSMSDISLWLAVMAIILLITSELLSATTEYSGKIMIEKRRLRLAALALGIGFMITVIMRVFQQF